MSCFTQIGILVLAMYGFCDGFNLKILMDRLDNVESGIEKQNKIRRQEMAAVYEKMSVIDSLEAKVKKLMDIVGAQEKPVAGNQEKEDIEESKEDIDESKDKNEDMRHFKQVIFDAFRREKAWNKKLHEDYKRLKIEMIATLNNHALNQSNAVDNMIEKVSGNINHINETLYDIKSTVDNVGKQANKNTDLGQELISRIGQVEDNMTSIQDDFDVLRKLQKEFAAPSEKKELLPNISFKAESCAMHKQLGHSNGVYDLWSSGHKVKFAVYCDQETDGGGWIVFQRRKDGSVDFDRNWNDYKLGFGDLNAEFWLGNEHVSRLTTVGTHELRIDMEDFDGNKAYAKYSHFKILPESEEYRLEVSGYSGNATDSFEYHNNKSFSTKDNWNGVNEYCKKYNAGWWFHDCFYSNLNGEYYQRKPPSSHLGIIWYYWLREWSTLKFTEMKFRKTVKVLEKKLV